MRKKTAPCLAASGAARRNLDIDVITKNTDNVKSFRRAVKDTERETEGVVDGIVTMKLFFEGGELLRHTISVTKKYRKAVRE
jgi:hypothetical protein